MHPLVARLLPWARRHINAIVIWVVLAIVGLVFEDWLRATAFPGFARWFGAWSAKPTGTILLLLVVWLAILALWAVVETSKVGAGLADRMRARLRRRREVTAVEKERADLILKVESQRQEMEHFKADSENLKQALFKQDQRFRFGEELREFPSLSGVQHEEVVSRAAELLPTLREMVIWSERVWSLVRPAAREGAPETAVASLVPFVDEKVREPMHATALMLNGFVENRKDPRALLACFYARYREWRTWVHRISRFKGEVLQSVQGYEEWWQFDNKWREELVQKVAAPNLARVRSFIGDYNQMHGDFTSMEAPISPTIPSVTQEPPGVRQ